MSRTHLPLDPVTPTAGGALAAGGIAFALYAVLRPYADESTAAGAVAVASPAWMVAHLLAMAALVLIPLGLYGLALHRSGVTPLRYGAGVAAIGSALVLPYYGAETFGLQAVAAEAVRAGTAMPPVTDAIRFGAAQSAIFVAGLVALAVAGVLVARVGRVGVPFALAMVLFLPQFFGPPPVRIAHGMLVLAGCVLLALIRRPNPVSTPAPIPAPTVRTHPAS